MPVEGEFKGRRRRERARQLSELIPTFLGALNHRCGGQAAGRGDELMAAWPDIVGSQLAPMAKVVGYADGVLTVVVAHSTLLGLLRQEKARLMQKLKERCPGAALSEIRLRLG